MLTITQPTVKIILVGCVAILAFDTIGSLASLLLGFSYSSLSIGSFLIYAAVGFIGTRYVNIKIGILAAGMVGLVESTIGWAISWLIGPGRLPEIPLEVVTIVITVIIVTLTAGIIGLLSSLVSLLFSRFFGSKSTT